METWRESLQPFKQDVLQYGRASLEALQSALTALAHTVIPLSTSIPAAIVLQVADDLVFLGQQLLRQYDSTAAKQSMEPSAGGTTACNGSSGQQQQGQRRQQQHQQLAPAVSHACCTYCRLVSTVLQPGSDQQHRQLYRFRARQHKEPQQQQQPPLLPTPAATSICSCLRRWADCSTEATGSNNSSSQAAAFQIQLQQAAVSALGVLLPEQLPALAGHERAAVLALLLSLSQPSLSSKNNMSAVSSCSVGNAVTYSDDCSTEVQCSALRILGKLCKQASSSGLQQGDLSAITHALVDALTTSCCSSSGGGSQSDGTKPAAKGQQGSRVNTERWPFESEQQSEYYAAVLGALSLAVSAHPQGWQASAGALTEAARKLLVYGCQQQQQHSQQQPNQQQQHSQQQQCTHHQQQPSQQQSNNQQRHNRQNIQDQQQRQQQPLLIAGSGNSSPSSTSTPPAASPKVAASLKYVPPHLRDASRTAGSPAATAAAAGTQCSSYQLLHDSSDDDSSEWSEASNSEHNNSMRWGSSCSRRQSRDNSKQQQQQLAAVDPIKAYRVRVALMQLLQTLVQTEAKALHPYLSALLPSQQPLQSRPLSPHLLTVLLYDPCEKVRLLAAAVLAALFEGIAARALLAMAEARNVKAHVRGFTTLSMSLGQMLVAIHTGLTAAVIAYLQQQQQQPGSMQQPKEQRQQQQQQQQLQMPDHVLQATLRVLRVLIPVTPYDRLPNNLLPDLVDATWAVWQNLQTKCKVLVRKATAAPAGGTASITASSNGLVAQLSLGRLPSGQDDSSSSSTTVTAVAVLAQALSTKKPLPGLAAWLEKSAANATSDAVHATASSDCSSSNASSSSSNGSLILDLFTASCSSQALVRIEALAALRGCSFNYPQALCAAAAGEAAVAKAAAATALSAAKAGCAVVGTGSKSNSNSAGGSSYGASGGSSGKEAAGSLWSAVLAALHHSLTGTDQVHRSPRGSLSSTSAAGSNGMLFGSVGGYNSSSSNPLDLSHSSNTGSSSSEVSGSTSPGDKAAQHAVRLLGDWLAAAWKHPGLVQVATGMAGSVTGNHTHHSSLASSSTDTLNHGHALNQPVAHDEASVCLFHMWQEALQLLLSDALQQHPSQIIRSAAITVLANIPAAVWHQLSAEVQQKLLAAVAAAATGDAMTAGRAAACKVLGHLVLLPAMLLGDQLWLQQFVLKPLTAGVKDAAVSVRFNGSWAVAAACDALRHQHRSFAADAAALADPDGQLLHSSTHAASLQPQVLQQLCQCALVASGDSEKVRANGIRAVGALLTAWQPCWGLTSIAGSTASTTTSYAAGSTAGTATSSGAGNIAGKTAQSTLCSAEACVWSWVPGWLKSAVAQLQSCLAARAMKVVWNAAYAAAGLLQNEALLVQPEVSASIPGLLLLLVVLVRDSSNYKIKIHAAAALGAVPTRPTYGDSFADALLGLLVSLETLESGGAASRQNNSSSSSGVSSAASGLSTQHEQHQKQQASNEAAALIVDNAGDADEGSFPNFRYILALTQQLQSSLLHTLSLLQPLDATRLRQPLQQRKAWLHKLIEQHRANEVRAVADMLHPSQQQQGQQQQKQQQQQQQTCNKHNGSDQQQPKQHQQQQLPIDPFGQHTQGDGRTTDGVTGLTNANVQRIIDTGVLAARALQGLNRLLQHSGAAAAR